ncbi:DUF4386 domain-containing protein [Microbacterium maritypicum]|uniref:DUF4386 domain-containing protein n=1 Tax=Microbacterium maritypicum TaxID=33918 RepID=UPI0022E5BC57|nr:DUF4386 domain-containing protein [Microbacterium liquefaciens]
MNTSLRTPALVAGISLALMVVLAPLGLLWALPAGANGAAALTVLVIAVLDVLAGVALYPVLKSGGELLALSAAALRVAYGAVFAVAAGFLLVPADTERFQAIWDAGLFIFGLHLAVVGVAVIRSPTIPTWIGLLVLIAGAGYAIDSATIALLPANPTMIGEFTFVGEVVLLVWLIGWCGRTRGIRTDRHVAATGSVR